MKKKHLDTFLANAMVKLKRRNRTRKNYPQFILLCCNDTHMMSWMRLQIIFFVRVITVTVQYKMISLLNAQANWNLYILIENKCRFHFDWRHYFSRKKHVGDLSCKVNGKYEKWRNSKKYEKVDEKIITTSVVCSKKQCLDICSTTQTKEQTNLFKTSTK